MSLAWLTLNMAETYKVRVTKDHLVFCSGHFISYEGDKCERLHGHNYRIEVTVRGELDRRGFVKDFAELDAEILPLIARLDHRILNDVEGRRDYGEWCA